MKKPTYEEVATALGDMLNEYCVIDEMLDGFMASAEPSKEERRRQRDSNRTRNRLQQLHERATR